MDDIQKKHMQDAAAQLPADAVRQMEVVVKKFFEEEGVPYDATHLKACKVMCHLFHPTLPPMYSEFVASSILLLIRLIEEEDTGLVASPIKP